MWTKGSSVDYDRTSLDIRHGWVVVRAIHRRGNLVKGKFDRRVLRRGKQCTPGGKRHGNSRRLDERGVLHLHGGTHLIYGARRLRLSHGLDRRLRATGAASGAVPQKVRQIHRAGLCGRQVLFESRTDCCRCLCDFRVVHLRSWTDARCGNRILTIPQRRNHGRRFDRHGHRVLLRPCWEV